MIYTLFYCIGIICTYASVRYFNSIPPNDPWSIKDRLYAVGLSIFSWAGFLLIWGIYIMVLISQWHEENKDNHSTW